MVLWAAGWCYFLLALFYLLTDVLKLNWLTFFFSVLGSHAIFVYMWAEPVSYTHLDVYKRQSLTVSRREGRAMSIPALEP